jgi:hypothetical protein
MDSVSLQSASVYKSKSFARFQKKAQLTDGDLLEGCAGRRKGIDRRRSWWRCHQAENRPIRTKERASQTVFAAYLNVTPGLVSKWERGEKRPQGTSLKLLSLVAKKGRESVA